LWPGIRNCRLTAKIGDRLIDGHVRPQSGEPGAHQPTRFIFSVRKQRDDFTPRGIVEQGQQSGALVLRCFLNEIRRIVGRKQPHPDTAFTRR